MRWEKKTTSTSWQIGAVMRRRQSHRLQMRTNRTSQWHSQTRPSFFRASTIGLGEMSRKAVVVDRAAFCFLHSGRETGGGFRSGYDNAVNLVVFAGIRGRLRGRTESGEKQVDSGGKAITWSF